MTLTAVTASALAAEQPAPILANNGTAGFLGKFLNSTDLDSSLIFQTADSRIRRGHYQPGVVLPHRDCAHAQRAVHVNGTGHLSVR